MSPHFNDGATPTGEMLVELMPRWLLRLSLFDRLFFLQSARADLAGEHDLALVVLGGQHRLECDLVLAISHRKDKWQQRLSRAQRVAEKKAALGHLAVIEGIEEAQLDELELEVLSDFQTLSRLARYEAEERKLDPSLRGQIRRFLQKLDALYALAVWLIQLGPVDGLMEPEEDDPEASDCGDGQEEGRVLMLDPQT